MKIYIINCWEERNNSECIIGCFRDFNRAYEKMIEMASHDNEVNNLHHADRFFKYGEDDDLKSHLYTDEFSALVDDDEGWKVKYFIHEEELQ